MNHLLTVSIVCSYEHPPATELYCRVKIESHFATRTLPDMYFFVAFPAEQNTLAPHMNQSSVANEGNYFHHRNSKTSIPRSLPSRCLRWTLAVRKCGNVHIMHHYKAAVKVQKVTELRSVPHRNAAYQETLGLGSTNAPIKHRTSNIRHASHQ